MSNIFLALQFWDMKYMFCLVNILELRDGRWDGAWENIERALFTVTGKGRWEAAGT